MENNMCTKKRKINIPKKVFLASNISELLTGPIPVKYKDPWSPTISCIIGQITINWALLDLEGSINLLPFSVYQQFRLDDLRPTRVTIQLADWSVKILKGRLQMSLYGSKIHLSCRFHRSGNTTCAKSERWNHDHSRMTLPSHCKCNHKL